MSYESPQSPRPPTHRRTRRASLLSLPPITTSSSPFAITSVKRTEAFGAFTPTSSAFSSLLCMAAPSLPITSLPSKRVARRRVRSIFHLSTSSDTEDESDNGPPSPKSSVPSFSRTSSYDHPVSSITSPASSSSATLFDDANSLIKPAPKTDLDPILAALEKRSKFCTLKARKDQIFPVAAGAESSGAPGNVG
ncbi:proteophosphoglycan ppg4 [Moniliophthora roreri]|nr:proteophosphoglycan ppg4 [Moniliophthora roreri]